jgi:hypothetical protein
MSDSNNIHIFLSIYDMKVDGKDYNKVRGIGLYHSGVQVGKKVFNCFF